MVSLQYASFYEPSTFLYGWLHGHIGHIYATFLRYELLNAISDECLLWKNAHTGCICVLSHQNVFLRGSSEHPPLQMNIHILYICMAFLQYVFACAWLE